MLDLQPYCPDSLWDSQFTWNTSTPRLTQCFQRTVLAWTPPLFLLLFLPILIYSLIKSNQTFYWNKYNTIRQFISSTMIVVSLADLIISLVDQHAGQRAVIINAGIKLLFSLIVSIVFYMFVKKAIHTSGIIWTYLALASISQLLQLAIVIADNNFQMRTDIILVINCALTLSLFSQSFIADTQSIELKKSSSDKNECPKNKASFASRLTFSWYSSLTYIGWKRPIIDSDVWLCRVQDSAIYNYNRFKKAWDLRNQKQIQNGNVTSVSILKLIWDSNCYYFMGGAFFKLFNDTFIFINPMIMKMLMSFVKSDEQSWHGYIYALCLFMVTSGQIFSLNYYFNRMLIFGIKVRTQLTASIYRKALKLSNASRSKFTVGQIVNLMAVDAQVFLELSTYINMIWSAPLQIVVALTLLWFELGISIFGGFFFLVILIPINAYLTNISKRFQSRQMKIKDERVKNMSEILNGVKIIKLYGWEEAFIKKIQLLRDRELKFLRQLNNLYCFLQALWTLAPFLVSFITFAIYVLIDSNNVLTPQKAFVSLALFNILRFPIAMIPILVTNIIRASVSVRRINDFLSSSELSEYIEWGEDKQNCIVLDNSSFSWSTNSDQSSSQEESIHLRNINMTVEKNSFVAIVGSVGSGKSSLLNAILGNMEIVKGNVRICKSMRIAFTPQEAWIQNNTLRDNILFGQEFNEDCYKQVVNGCSLMSDFSILPGGDLTEIGEKGINLSGGQKQRVSLARACYNDADIYLLDDPLSAVDSHVGKHIFENILHSKTGLLRNKTRILATNNLTILPQTDKIFVLQNGQIIESGSYNELIEQDKYFANLIRQYSSADENTENGNNENIPSENGTGNTLDFKVNKLVEKEEAQTGRVKIQVYIRYLKSISLVWCAIIAISYVLAESSNVSSSVWLSHWSKTASEVTERSTSISYLLIYGLLGIGQGTFKAIGWYLMTKGVLGAARMLHNQMLFTIFRSSMAFFDVTPLGRILNRFSKDIDVCDSTIQTNIRVMLQCLFTTLSTLILISAELPIFLVIILPMVVCFYFIQKLYISTARQLKRLESISKSPVYSHFSETLSGVATIRAYSANDQFIDKNDHNVDVNNSCYFASVVSNRWLSIRLELIANSIVLFSAIFSVLYRDNLSPSSVGLIITYALSTTMNLNFFVRSTTDIETNIVGVERILEYTDLSTEAEWNIKENKPDKDWPSQGIIEFVNYATRYRPGLDLVLKGISATINVGEKIGIVGRTGAGKSSLTLALFRLIEPASGTIVIDGVDISKLGLHQLRQRLTIIPQDPILFSGTIRTNLDPFCNFTDEELWKSLEHSHLKSFIMSTNSKLEHEVTEGGGNLSVGQRQLICLARALLRKTKILILDEATAAVDMETDSLIQKTIRRSFADCTILTIAHRLNTIMDSDRVMVLSDGNMIEFDSPENLLDQTNSYFYSMVEAAGLLNKANLE